MVKVLLQADDFGLHGSINRAVIDAARQGVLTGASLMANGPAASEAITWLRDNPSFPAGVHLNILRGRPLSDPHEIPTLVDGRGLFLNSARSLWARSVAGGLDAGQIYKEYRRQVLSMIDNDIVPTHLDGEKHTHIVLPQAATAVERLIEEFGIRKVRCVRERPLYRLFREKGVPVPCDMKQYGKLIVLEYLSGRAGKRWTGIAAPDYSFGIGISGLRMTHGTRRELLKTLFELPVQGTVEWIFHPAYDTEFDEPRNRALYGPSFLREARVDEYRFLVSEDTIRTVSEHEKAVISYRDI
ncbi:MAG: ChbG/HpnK family deacetylase [Deltaproteobacteria bacterium]|nr:ChbG/HpnK family deacetylase [Deltaproteobacteria bacterium]